MFKKKETYIEKTAGDNIVEFTSRMNQHISDSRTGVSTCNSPYMPMSVDFKTNA